MKELYLISVFFFLFFQSFTQVKLSENKFEIFEHKDFPHISQEIVDDLHFLTKRNRVTTYYLNFDSANTVELLTTNDVINGVQSQFLSLYFQKVRYELSSVMPPYEDSVLTLEDGWRMVVYAPAEYIFHTLDSKEIVSLYLVKENNKYTGFAISAILNESNQGYVFDPLFVKFEDLNKI